MRDSADPTGLPPGKKKRLSTATDGPDCTYFTFRHGTMVVCNKQGVSDPLDAGKFRTADLNADFDECSSLSPRARGLNRHR